MLDKQTNKILVIAAEYGASTAPAQPNGRPGRAPLGPGSFSIIAVGK